MIIIDKQLEKLQKENRPLKIGMIGAGFMARGIALQLIQTVPGMRLVAVANRTVEKAKVLYEEAKVTNIVEVQTQDDLNTAIESNSYAITNNPYLLTENEQIDIIVEVTGTIEYAAGITLSALQNKKHVVHINAELEATLGPILKYYADQNGVVYTNSDGDQPGVTMNLYRFVKGIGLSPVLCGNIKGLHDPYRNPTTQENYAKTWKQNAPMVTSFADGSKISFEQAVTANATGMTVAKRGMHGFTVPTGTPIEEAAKLFTEELDKGNKIVDYLVGAHPAPGVFVIGTMENEAQKHYLNYYKLGQGPYYVFYTPYHLCHFEVPHSIARAGLFQDATITPLDRPYVEVVTTAKTDLKAGDKLDGIGHYTSYGLCENAEVARQENLLPLGLSEGCVLTRDIQKDQVITFADVTLPDNRLADKLWQEQIERFEK